jgi:hypothetical protein
MMRRLQASDNTSLADRDRELDAILTDLQGILTERLYPKARVKQLLIQLANRLVDIKACENKDISRAIKHLLKDNIIRGEITPRYIPMSLSMEIKEDTIANGNKFPFWNNTSIKCHSSISRRGGFLRNSLQDKKKALGDSSGDVVTATRRKRSLLEDLV